MTMNTVVNEITITLPDDWHMHFRDGDALQAVLPHTAEVFGRGLVMPNLKPPVTTVEMAQKYRRRIFEALPYRSRFEPLMTLYLTDNTSPDEVCYASESGFVQAFKLYPAGATTNSDAGVTDIEKVYPVLEKMEEFGMTLCIHGEVVDPEVDIFDREAVFIERVLGPMRQRFPELPSVLEHVTTEEAVDFVMGTRLMGATITAHHLLENRNALFRGGINPHYWCLPVLKRERHREALLWAATSGNPQFFFGSDTAPHAKGAKESACGCAGCYMAHAALPFCAEAFDSVGKLDMLEGFVSHHGAAFYGLQRNKGKVTLVREPWQIPTDYPFGDSVVVPFRAGQMAQWKVK